MTLWWTKVAFQEERNPYKSLWELSTLLVSESGQVCIILILFEDSGWPSLAVDVTRLVSCSLQNHCHWFSSNKCSNTIMILSFQTDRSGQTV